MSGSRRGSIRSDPGFLTYICFGVDWNATLCKAIREPLPNLPEEYRTTAHFLFARGHAILSLGSKPIDDKWIARVSYRLQSSLRSGLRRIPEYPGDDPRQTDHVLTPAAVLHRGEADFEEKAQEKVSSVYAALGLALCRIAVDVIEDPEGLRGLVAWEIFVASADALGRAHEIAQRPVISRIPRGPRHPKLFAEAEKIMSAGTVTSRRTAQLLISKHLDLVRESYPGKEDADIEDTLARRIRRWFPKKKR